MRTKKKARNVAFPAIFGALALVVLWLGTMLPAGTWGMAALAGLMPLAVTLSAGVAAGLLCWAGVSVLAFLLLPDRFLVLLFGAFFGLYPILKGLIEDLRKLPLEYILKLAFFNLSLSVVYMAMRSAVLDSLPAFLQAVWLLYLTGNVVFLLYDYGLGRLAGLYVARVRGRVR